MKLKAVECEVERLLAVIAGKWKVLLLRELFPGARRHAQLCKALAGISKRVLTAQLRELELDGVVQRKDFGTKRPHVEYALTPFGEKLRRLVPPITLKQRIFLAPELSATLRMVYS